MGKFKWIRHGTKQMENHVSLVRHTIFVGASFNHSANLAGIGMVVHATNQPRRNGPIVSRHSEPHAVPPVEIEMFANLRALELANREGWRTVRVKSPSQRRKRLKAFHQADLHEEHTGLTGAILRLAKTFDKVEFRHVARRKNQNAMKLARIAAGTHQRYPDDECDDTPSLWEMAIEHDCSPAFGIEGDPECIPF